jgi:hypothetical protein
VTQFRENKGGWGGERFPVAVDARAGVEEAVAAHAAVDRVQSGHQPAAVGVSRVEHIGLPGANRAQLGEHVATLRAIEAGAVDPPQGGGGRADQLGRVAGGVRKPDTDRGSIQRLDGGDLLVWCPKFPVLMRGPSAIQERIDLIPEREACLPLVGWQ